MTEQDAMLAEVLLRQTVFQGAFDCIAQHHCADLHAIGNEKDSTGRVVTIPQFGKSNSSL